jgi:hypothetical protein
VTKEEQLRNALGRLLMNVRDIRLGDYSETELDKSMAQAEAALLDVPPVPRVRSSVQTSDDYYRTEAASWGQRAVDYMRAGDELMAVECILTAAAYANQFFALQKRQA